MSRVFSFYYDGTIVQAVTVQSDGASLTLEDARTFPLAELPEFLSGCRSRSCIICSNPPLFYQNILHLPPAATRHYPTLIRNEIATLHPELTSFSMYYQIVGEVLIEAKAYRKVAVYCYPDDFLHDFITELNRSNIAVAGVYAAPLVLSRLALSADDSADDRPRLFIAPLPGEKQLLVCEQDGLEFVRKLPSTGSNLLLEDAANINMTLDYCFQTLRLQPAEAIMINRHHPAEETSGFISAPFHTLFPPLLETLPDNTAMDYLAPLAAALHAVTEPRTGSIMPRDYVVYARHKRLLTIAILFLCLVAFLCGGLLVAELRSNGTLKSAVAAARSRLSGSARDLADFHKLDTEVTQLKQPLDVVNSHNAALNPATALAALQIPPAAAYLIKSVTVQKGDKSLTVQIDGIINASSFSDTQHAYEGLVAHVKGLPGYSITSSKVDVKQKGFSIVAGYNGTGGKGK